MPRSVNLGGCGISDSPAAVGAWSEPEEPPFLSVLPLHAARRDRCLKDQADACSMVLDSLVPDVGFISLLTRCRSGLARMVATGRGYTVGWRYGGEALLARRVAGVSFLFDVRD